MAIHPGNTPTAVLELVLRELLHAHRRSKLAAEIGATAGEWALMPTFARLPTMP